MNKNQVFTHQVGDTVSVARRISDYGKYTAVVKAEKAKPGSSYECNAQGTICSFAYPNDTEFLLMWLEAGRGYPTDCIISYKLLPKQTAVGFRLSYEGRVLGRRYRGIESPGKSLRGNLDNDYDTHRAVIQDTTKVGKVDEYEGLIINPPYPRRRNQFRNGRPEAARTYLFGALAIAGGVALVALLRSQRKPPQ